MIKSLENLSLDEKLAPFAEKTLAVSLSDKAEANARNVIGNGPFGQELAEGVRTVADGPSVTVDHVTNDTNHLAEHVHEGGVSVPGTANILRSRFFKESKKSMPLIIAGTLLTENRLSFGRRKMVLMEEHTLQNRQSKRGNSSSFMF